MSIGRVLVSSGAIAMCMIGSMPSFRFSRSPGLTLVAFLGVLCAAYEAADLILEGDVISLVMSGMAFVGLAIVVAILNDWRRGLDLLLGGILFSDLSRQFLRNNTPSLSPQQS